MTAIPMIDQKHNAPRRYFVDAQGHRVLIGLSLEETAEFEALEVVLHNSIIHCLNNPLIEVAYKRMHYYLRLVRLDRKLTAPLALRSLREHMQIILACRDRDPETAMVAVQAHFSAALQRHMGLY